MGWYHVLPAQEGHTATRQLANEFASMYELDCDRPFSSDAVERIKVAVLMDDGYKLHWVSALLRETGEKFILKGRHTAHALAEMGGLPHHPVTVDRYECDTVADLVGLFHRVNGGINVVDDRNLWEME